MAKSTTPYETINNIDFTINAPAKNDFEYCEFISCTFGDLSRFSFIDCTFKDCNLSNIKTLNTRLQNCSFKDCKLLGANFSGVKDPPFEVHFENCNLDYSSFDKKNLTNSSFKNCKIHNSNFTQANLSKGNMTGCDLFETLFSNTNLAGMDFTSNRNFIIDPELNNIKGAKFLSLQLAGLLYRYNIHIE